MLTDADVLKSGYLPLHYVARFHGDAAGVEQTLALLRAIGGEHTLEHSSTGTAEISDADVCRLK